MPGDAGTTEETATAQGPAPSVEMGRNPSPPPLPPALYQGLPLAEPGDTTAGGGLSTGISPL